MCNSPNRSGGGPTPSGDRRLPLRPDRMADAVKKASQVAFTPETILEGDYLELDVPPQRSIPAGHYVATVTRRLNFKPTGVEEYAVTIPVKRRPRTSLSFRLTIYRTPLFVGQCFLGTDRWPVAYRHVPNPEERLRRSLP